MSEVTEVLDRVERLAREAERGKVRTEIDELRKQRDAARLKLLAAEEQVVEFQLLGETDLQRENSNLKTQVKDLEASCRAKNDQVHKLTQELDECSG